MGAALPAIVFCALVLICCLPQRADCYVDPVYSPRNLTDTKGNHASEDNEVRWASVPAGANYTDVSPNELNLDTFFDMVDAFLYVLQPDDPPYDEILKMYKGDLDGDGQKELAMYGAGIVFCFVVGLLFIIIMPIVGCCFCCCRLCGNCGGKRLQKQGPNTRCKCVTFSIVLTGLLLLTGAGAACLMGVNENMSSSYTNLDDNIINSLDNLVTYLENTAEELNFVALDGFKFTSSMVERDLDNMDVLVGIKTRSQLDQEAGVSTTVDGLFDMDTAVDTVLADFEAINSSSAELKVMGDSLTAELQSVSADITATKSQGGCAASCQAIGVSGLQMDADFDQPTTTHLQNRLTLIATNVQLPDITTNIQLLRAIQAADMANSINEGKATFDAIPTLIADQTEDVAGSINKLMSDYVVEVENYLAEVNDLPNSVLDPVDDLKSTLTDYSDTIEDYDQYRWYAMGGVVVVIAAVVLLGLVSVVLGAVAYDSGTLPTKRGCLSNSAGIMLMIVVAFSWIFSCLLAWFVTLPFLPGSLMQKLVCEPLMDPEYKAFKTLLDEPGGMFGDKYFFGDLLLNDGSVPLGVSSVLKDCENNTAAYTALMLENLFDLDSMVDYKDSIDVEAEMNKMNVDFSSVSIINAQTENLLNQLSVAVQIDYDQFQNVLSKPTVKTDLSVMAATLRGVALDGTNSDPAMAELLAEADELDRIDADSVQPLETKQSALLARVDRVEADTASIPSDTTGLIDDAKAAETYVRNNGMDVTKQHASSLSDRLINTIDTFMERVEETVKTEVSKCRPIWLFWEAIVHETMCEDFIWLLNGFWFALGWCVFLMVPSIIFSVKLSKYFRKMKYAETLDPLSPASSYPKNPPAKRLPPLDQPPVPPPMVAPMPPHMVAPMQPPMVAPMQPPMVAPVQPMPRPPPAYDQLPPAPENLYDNKTSAKTEAAPVQPAEAKPVPQMTPVGFDGITPVSGPSAPPQSKAQASSANGNTEHHPTTVRPASPSAKKPNSPPRVPKPPRLSKSNKVAHHDDSGSQSPSSMA